jgi:PAS domain S-box-containing protein
LFETGLAMKIFSILMVLLGALFLSGAFLPARRIWRTVSGELRSKWLVLLNLMNFFLLGYLLFDVVIFFNLPIPLELMTAGVFLGGAVFVFIIINLSQNTITAQQKAEENIKLLNDSLEQKVAERTQELKRLSDFNRVVLDSIADPISILDVKSLRIVDANRAFLKEINLPEEQIIGRTCFEVTHHRSSPCTPPHDICPLMETLSNDNHATTLHVHWTLSGEKRYVEVLTSPIRDEKENIVQAVHIQRDITERKLAEEELHKKNAEIEQFIYTVSHDLRSPLVTVKTFTGYLENDMADNNKDRVSQDLQFINSAADKMKLLLDELLEMSRIDRVETPLIRVSLIVVVVEVLDIMAGIISERKVDIQLPNTDLILFVDRTRLCQVWQNLIENAIKYSHNDSVPKIELGVESLNGETIFFVKDNGIGIDPQFHSKIFGIFDKLDPKSPGAGIGLSMVQRIVEKCGGRVWVESGGVGHGSCFRFTLPDAITDSGG